MASDGIPMTQPIESPSARAAARRVAAEAKRGRRIVRTLANGTLLAAGIAATQICIPEIDPRYRVFNPTLVDRLQAPITRRHE
jgi:hypothetical protein